MFDGGSWWVTRLSGLLLFSVGCCLWVRAADWTGLYPLCHILLLDASPLGWTSNPNYNSNLCLYRLFLSGTDDGPTPVSAVEIAWWLTSHLRLVCVRCHVWVSKVVWTSTCAIFVPSLPHLWLPGGHLLRSDGRKLPLQQPQVLRHLEESESWLTLHFCFTGDYIVILWFTLPNPEKWGLEDRPDSSYTRGKLESTWIIY